MLLTKKEMDIYGLKQPTERQMEKVTRLYNKIFTPSMSTLKGFYILFGSEIIKLNIDKINSIEDLMMKIKRYKRQRRKLAKEGKLARCYNCAFRVPGKKTCRLTVVTYDGLTYNANTDNNDSCICFFKRDIW